MIEVVRGPFEKAKGCNLVPILCSLYSDSIFCPSYRQHLIRSALIAWETRILAVTLSDILIHVRSCWTEMPDNNSGFRIDSHHGCFLFSRVHHRWILCPVWCHHVHQFLHCETSIDQAWR